MEESYAVTNDEEVEIMLVSEGKYASCSGSSGSSSIGGSSENGDTKKLTVDLEDLIKVTPLKFIGSVEMYREIVSAMLEIECESRKDMMNFIRVQWKKYSVNFSPAMLLHMYRKFCAEGDYYYELKYEPFLRAVGSRSKSGVLVVAVFVSPYPGIDLTKDNELYEKLKNKEDSESAENEDEDDKIKAGKFSCEYDCKFCPAEPGQPRSYLLNEPGVLRAFRNKYDPVLQMRDRISSYVAMGHPIDKLEVLVLGGTWSSFKKEYQEYFITCLFYAANTYFQEDRRSMNSLEEERDENESALVGIIGITLETRPDRIDEKELVNYRRYGVTRVQMGAQSFSDSSLRRINRRCQVKDLEKASMLLKRSGFKFDIHLMPDLPQPYVEGVPTHKKIIEKDDINWSVDMVIEDVNMMWNFIYNPKYQADQAKFYPCETVPWSNLLEENKRGIYVPYGDKMFTYDELNDKYNFESYPEVDWDFRVKIEILSHEDFKSGFFSFMKDYMSRKVQVENDKDEVERKRRKVSWIRKNKYRQNYDESSYIDTFPEKKSIEFNLLFMLLMYSKMHVKPYVRLNRVIRDIPNMYHRGGVSDTNMRQYLHNEMKAFGYRCHCIRCREIKGKSYDPDDVIIDVIKYRASEGDEYFIQLVTKSSNKYDLLGFLRLRIDPYSGYNVRGNVVVFKDHVEAGLIRELHVYGQVVATYSKKNREGIPQHSGFGTRLLNKAFEITQSIGYKRMSVISGEGVKGYYRKFGFTDGEYFMVMTFDELSSEAPVYENNERIVIRNRNRNRKSNNIKSNIIEDILDDKDMHDAIYGAIPKIFTVLTFIFVAWFIYCL